MRPTFAFKGDWIARFKRRFAHQADPNAPAYSLIRWYYSAEDIPGKFVVAIRDGKKLYYDAPSPPPHMLEGAEHIVRFWESEGER